MLISSPRRRGLLVASMAAVGLLLAGCASGTGGDSPSSSGDPVKIGMVYPQTGPLAGYGKPFRDAFTAGIDFLTDGTDAVDGHPIQVDWTDDANDPQKGIAAAKQYIGDGYQILSGPVSSSIANPISELAAQNQTLFISGPATDNALTGKNKYTFRAARQTEQDTLTVKAALGDVKGKKISLFVQDNAFGKASIAAFQSVFGDTGATLNSVPVPEDTTDVTPFVLQLLGQDPDLVYVNWGGNTSAAMWKVMADQGVFDKAIVTGGIGTQDSWDARGDAATKIQYVSFYLPDIPQTQANDDLVASVKKIKDYALTEESSDGWVAAQMVIQALTEVNGDASDVDGMISALEGWSFDAPKGTQTIRADDHAMLQPMYLVELTKDSSGTLTPKLLQEVSADDTAPTLTPFQ